MRIFYILFFVVSLQNLVYILRWEPATFPLLSSHMWPVAAVVDSAGLGRRTPAFLTGCAWEV